MACQRIPAQVHMVLLYLIAPSFLFAQSNDNFADRAVLVGSSLVQYADSTFATSEPLEPPWSNRSLWWSWTAPTNGLLNIRSIMFRNVECSVWTGDSLTNLVHVATATFGSYLPPVQWPPTLSYPILRSEVEAGQTYHLRFTTVHATQYDFGFSLDLCTMQITKPLAGVFNGPTNMAIEVTPARSDIEGTATGMMVGIGPGSIYGNPGSYATPLSGAAPFTGTITNLLPGVYSLTAWGTNSAGRFISTRSVPVRVAPGNDNFASARAITGWITNEQFRMDGSSMEHGEPDFNGLTNAATLWWKWNATSNSTVLIHSYGIPISVFEGDSLASLHLVGSSLPHVIRLDAVIGNTYYIRAAANLYEGPGFLHVSSPVANDDFANSILLSGNDVTFVVTNAAASIEAGEPAHDDEFSGPRGSLWWHFVAGAKGVLLLEPIFEISVDVFSGTGFSDLIRRPPLSTTSLPDAAVYRVRENQRINFAFDFPYHWAANRSLRLRFIPDPPEHKIALIQLSRDESCFALQAEIGEAITIEASADLKNWFVVDSAIATETVVYLGSPFAVDDNYMFFRSVRRAPSPP
jgi:hypothetical protein